MRRAAALGADCCGLHEPSFCLSRLTSHATVAHHHNNIAVMEGDLSPTEERLLQTIKKLRAQNDELVAENDALHLRCERQEATIKDLTDASSTQQSGRDSSHDSYAVVARPGSVEPHSDHEPVAPATPDPPPFKVMAEVLVRHDHRLTDLEQRLKTQELKTEQAEVSYATSCTAQDLQRRVLSLETQPISVASDGSGNNSTDPGKEHKRIMRALVRSTSRIEKARSKLTRCIRINSASSRTRPRDERKTSARLT